MKGFAIGFLNFLLFICLCILGVVTMLNLTILNPDFVVAQMDEVDASPLIKQQIEDQFVDFIPSEFQSVAVPVIEEVIDELEPWLILVIFPVIPPSFSSPHLENVSQTVRRYSASRIISSSKKNRYPPLLMRNPIFRCLAEPGASLL